MNAVNILLRDLVVAILALAVLVALPYVTSSSLILDFLIRLAAFGIFATSLNVLVGYGGLVSLGHAMFFGCGAYVFGLLMQRTATSVPMALLAAVVFCAMLGLIVGVLCVRSKGLYFAFLTLAFSLFAYNIILSWASLTGGNQGLIGGIPTRPFWGMNLANERDLYLFSSFLAVICLLLMRLLMESPFGYTLRMTRDNPERARFLGINVWRTKLYAFVLSAAFAGVGGAILALFASGAYPEFAYWLITGEAIFMIMMGGVHFFVGPLVGAFLFLIFNDTVTRVTDYYGLTLGVIVLIFALGFKQGILSFVIRLFAPRTLQRSVEQGEANEPE